MTDIPDRQERERSERMSNLFYYSLAGSHYVRTRCARSLNPLNGGCRARSHGCESLHF